MQQLTDHKKQRWLVLIAFAFLLAPAVVLAQSNITRVEYYIDTDPGYGNATNVSISPSADISNLVIPINPASIAQGVHRFYVRAKDENGSWSLSHSWLLYKSYTQPAGDPAHPIPKLVKLEYYIDTDPGYGNATNVSISPSADISNLVIPINPASIAQGIHHFYVRAKDENGSWSLTNNWLFYKSYTQPAGDPAHPIPKLVKLEYYIDTDPGYGNGVPVALDSLSDFNNYIVPINVTGFATGAHTFWLRGLDKNGNWSMVNSLAFNVPSEIAAPSIVVNSITQTLRCARDSFDLSYDASGTYNVGNEFHAELSDGSGNFGSPTVVGTFTGTGNAIMRVYLPSHLAGGNYKIRVSSTNPVVSGFINASDITIHDRPKAQTVTGVTNANIATAYNFSVPTVAGSTWKWIVSGSTVSQTDNSAFITWNADGQPRVINIVETNQYGCVGDTSLLSVNVYTPTITNVASSSLTPCPGGSITVSGNATGVYDAGNVFTAQLSNATGSFTSPVNIGTANANPVGMNQSVNINAQLPMPLSNGTGYRVRIIADKPGVTGSDNGTNILVDKPDLGADQTITIPCAGGTADLTTVYNTSGYTVVDYGVPTPAAVTAGSYTLTVTNVNGCQDNANITVMPPRTETVVSTGGIAMGTTRECTDADGWTHYYNNNGTPADYSDDIRIMSIKKNGNDIGTVGLGGGNQFMANVVSVAGAAAGQGIDVQSTLVGAGNHFYSMYRYWDINAAKQPLTPVNIRFYFHTSDVNDVDGSAAGNITADQLTAYHLPDGNPDPSSNWAGASAAGYYSPGTVPALDKWVYTDLGNGIGQAEFLVSSFSGGGLGFYQMGPVPVQLLSFTATPSDGNVMLRWSTASESNTDKFIVQRSTNGVQFENVGSVNAAGNSSTRRNYLFEDEQLQQAATYYYRLQMKDRDGKEKYSEVRSVRFKSAAVSARLAYNPVKNEALIEYTGTADGRLRITVMDNTGRLVMLQEQQVVKGLNSIRVNTAKLASGFYEVHVADKAFSKVLKMIKR